MAGEMHIPIEQPRTYMDVSPSLRPEELLEIARLM